VRTTLANGRPGPPKRRKVARKGDGDFLSSIALVVVLHAETILMQNWEHVKHVVTNTSLLAHPRAAHGCDFSRVLSLLLDGNGRLALQTVLSASLAFPELAALFETGRNAVGRWRVEPAYADPVWRRLGLARDTAVARPEVHRLPLDPDAPLAAVPAARLQYVLDAICTDVAPGTLLLVPSYLDLVQLRLALSKSGVAHAVVTEYCEPADVSRARTAFFHGDTPLLVVSERFHFYKRYRIRGARRVVFYAPPARPEFYVELGLMGDASPAIVVSPHDAESLRRIFGAVACAKVLSQQ
jgi:U3 small nucleolar RNA-associated protein 25